MDNNEKKRLKRIYILRGIKNAFICDGLAVIILIIIGFIYAILKNASITKCIYMSFYYGGAFSLIFAVPQFYIKNKDPKHQKISRLNPMYGFYDWFGSENGNPAMMDSFQEFKGDSFWLGIMITVFGATLLALAFILENIFF